MCRPKRDTFEKDRGHHSSHWDDSHEPGLPQANHTHKDMLDKDDRFPKLEFRILIFNENGPICKREGIKTGKDGTRDSKSILLWPTPLRDLFAFRKIPEQVSKRRRTRRWRREARARNPGSNSLWVNELSGSRGERQTMAERPQEEK